MGIGSVYAIDNICTQGGVPLNEGELNGKHLYDCLLNSLFSNVILLIVSHLGYLSIITTSEW